MAKKKASMSLKDFHGGSIPSDLSLPSAPGVFVRSTDLSGYDRPSSRVCSLGRPDQWVRPNSSPAARRFDDKTPFLGPAVPIGRHFDEDERKPLDGSPVPRRTVSDDSFQVQPIRVQLKPEPAPNGRASGSAVRTHSANSYSGRIVEGANMGLSLQSAAGSAGQMQSSANAWGVRKDSVVSVDEPMQSSWPGGGVVTKLACASALEKVSSGRWQTKQSFPYQTDAEVTDNAGAGKILGSLADDEQKYHRITVAAGKDTDVMLARHLERDMAIGDGMQVPRKEHADHNGAKASSYGKLNERNPLVHQDKVQPSHIDGRLSGSVVVHPPVESEATERPKLKLLPRTKPLKSSETPVSDQKQGSRGQNDSSHGHIATTQELHGNLKPGIAGGESEEQVVERPKLNLKPRSQSLDQLEANNERERVALFGGARPRELVLKERGIDDSAINNHQDIGQQSDRVRHNVSKTERLAQHTTSHQGEKADDPNLNSRIGRKSERKDQPTDNEIADLLRKNWHNEDRMNSGETDRQLQPQQFQRERQLSPESWRKPVEQQKPATHYGKAASALELAQAFSRSVSDPKAADLYSGHKAPPSKTQMPFSRLMGPTPRPQINGY